MTNLTKHAEGWLIGKDIYLGVGNHGKVNLWLTKWPQMTYGKNEERVIDFPGEYDIASTWVTCFEADDALHYITHVGNEKVAILQNSAALEVRWFDAIDTWVCIDPSIKNEIERLEMDGDIVIFEEMSAE